jgi:hypothetical protein
MNKQLYNNNYTKRTVHNNNNEHYLMFFLLILPILPIPFILLNDFDISIHSVVTTKYLN